MKDFPPVIPLRALLGPSFVILALGLGSGEVILWPYLASNYGLGIVWGALLGITFQFFINMEIERYALVRGESVFVGIARMFHPAIYWFIVSTFIGFGLPGIAAASAQVVGHLVGVERYTWIAMAMLVGIGVMLSVGKTVYGTLERITKTIIMLGVPFLFILTVFIASGTDWGALLRGLVGQGDGYTLLPAGISLATFLAAFAYSGAGGNLNLTQSIYVREKGYGMGAYAHKMVGLFRDGAHHKIKLSGEDFEHTPDNIARFRAWWRAINIEHAVVFWGVGLVSMLMLMVLSFVTTHGVQGVGQGITFVLLEGQAIGSLVAPWVGGLFLAVVAVMLFQTQLGILDSTSRIMGENVALGMLKRNPERAINLSRVYFVCLWAQIGFGLTLFALGVQEPKTLIVLGAVINAFAMFVHITLVSILNHRQLAPVFRPSWGRRVVLAVVWVFFLGFCGVVAGENIMKLVIGT